MKRRLSWLTLLIGLPLGAVPTDFDLTNQLSVEGGYRFAGQMDSSRTAVSLSAKKNLLQGVEFQSDVWAWKNFSSANYHTMDSEVSLRSLKVSYWGEPVSVVAGLQEIHWGESFGSQPVDLVNVRNYRDYALLDQARNKIPAPILDGMVSTGQMKFHLLGNPAGQVPILPDSIRGYPVVNADRNSQWLTYPEFGAKATLLGDDSNLDLFAYRHLSRLAVLLPSMTPTGPGLCAYYQPVTSVGASFSKSFSDVVLRADNVVTVNAPYATAAGGVAERAAFSHTVGADWSPSDLWSGFTVGLQGHVDKYATLSNKVAVAASVLARKSLIRDRLELETQAYASATYSDRWLSGSVAYKAGDGWEAKLTAEGIRADSDSPLSLFAGTSRVLSRLTYTF